MGSLANKSPAVRKAPVEALSGFGTAFARRVVPAMVKMIEDADPDVRTAAVGALSGFGAAFAQQVVPALLKAVEDDDPDVRTASILALRSAGLDAASEAVPALAKATGDPEPGVCREAVRALGWLGLEAVRHVPELVRVVVGDAQQVIREEAVVALLAIDPEGVIALPALTAVPEGESREGVLRTLRKIGPGARCWRRKLEANWNTGQAAPDRIPGVTGGVDGDQASRPQGRHDTKTSHPDGLEEPVFLWWNGKRHAFSRVLFTLLSHLWGKESVCIFEVARSVWNTSQPTPSQVKSALKKLNDRLLAAGVPWTYAKRGQYITKE